MAPARKNPVGLKVAVIIFLILCLTFLKSRSVGMVPYRVVYNANKQKRHMVLGSRPPACVNKCKNCRPCKATLVIPPHEQRNNGYSKSSGHGDDDSYYLLSWKCRCGDKLFQP